MPIRKVFVPTKPNAVSVRNTLVQTLTKTPPTLFIQLSMHISKSLYYAHL